MQYVSWPDHGVPDDCSDFLEFVNEVRQSRSGVVESTVVHCRSASGLDDSFSSQRRSYFHLASSWSSGWSIGLVTFSSLV